MKKKVLEKYNSPSCVIIMLWCVNTVNKQNIFPKIENMILIENQGDDNIFRYCPSANIFEDMNIKLFDYILQRFNSILD